MMTPARGRILAVDDSDNMRGLLRDILVPRHDLSLAASGASARVLLGAQRFEVVLTDVRMPDLDGFELVQLVKRSWPLTEVVVMTAFASIPAAVEAIRLGAYDYIAKPFDPDDVQLLVARALERHRVQSAGPAVPRSLTPRTTERLSALSYKEALTDARGRGSNQYLVALLKTFHGNVSRAAERAGLERESLHRLLRRYGIRAETFRNPAPGEDGG